MAVIVVAPSESRRLVDDDQDLLFVYLLDAGMEGIPFVAIHLAVEFPSQKGLLLHNRVLDLAFPPAGIRPVLVAAVVEFFLEFLDGRHGLLDLGIGPDLRIESRSGVLPESPNGGEEIVAVAFIVAVVVGFLCRVSIGPTRIRVNTICVEAIVRVRRRFVTVFQFPATRGRSSSPCIPDARKGHGPPVFPHGRSASTGVFLLEFLCHIVVTVALTVVVAFLFL